LDSLYLLAFSGLIKVVETYQDFATGILLALAAFIACLDGLNTGV
jgi:hypothetical protein